MTWQIFAYNLKKVPRKPYPVGQECKTIADNVDTNENLVAVSFRDLKVKAIIGTCGVTTRRKIRRFRNPNTGEMVEVVRPKVFDEYEENKSKLKKRIEQ